MSFCAIFGPDERAATRNFSCKFEVIISTKTCIVEERLFESIMADHIWLKRYTFIPLRWNIKNKLWTRIDVSFTICNE